MTKTSRWILLVLGLIALAAVLATLLLAPTGGDEDVGLDSSSVEWTVPASRAA